MRRFAVVGSPISHSLSPLIHDAAYSALGITDARYDRFEVGKGELAQFLSSATGQQLDGLSVTMPLKREAYEIATERDVTAQTLGIANTLIRRADGSFRAENHDVHGIEASIRAVGLPQLSTAAVLGSGATAASAVLACANLGASTVMVTARRSEAIAALEPLAHTTGVSLIPVPLSESSRTLEADALISALALPGAETVAEQWRDEDLPAIPPRACIDVLYDPWPAPIAQVLGERYCDSLQSNQVRGGLDMLVHQADMQLRSMLGIGAAPLEEMMRAAVKELDSRADRA